MSSITAPSWGELLSGRNGLRSIALAGGVALHAINIYIATTILPSVVRDIGGLEYYAWNTTLFMAASIVGAPLSANVLSRFGPRAAYLVALVVFCAGTLACALARDMPWMLVGRAAQGFGGGILFALSYALIRIVFDERLWSRAMAMVSGMWGVATLCGPAIGGVFAQSGTWRLAFVALVPVAAVLALIVIVQLPAREASGARAARPAIGKILLLAASVLVVSVASLSKEIVANVAGVAAGLAIALLIARFERGAARRLLPTGAYDVRAPLGAIYACMSLLVIGMTTEIFVPYFLQIIHGYPPLLAGYLTALMAAGWTVGSLFSSGRRRRPRRDRPCKPSAFRLATGSRSCRSSTRATCRTSRRTPRTTRQRGSRCRTGRRTARPRATRRTCRPRACCASWPSGPTIPTCAT